MFVFSITTWRNYSRLLGPPWTKEMLDTLTCCLQDYNVVEPLWSQKKSSNFKMNTHHRVFNSMAKYLP